MLLGVIGTWLTPWRRVVFDRTTKTITVPARFRTQRKETILYEQAVVTMSFNPKAKTFCGKGEEEIMPMVEDVVEGLFFTHRFLDHRQCKRKVKGVKKTKKIERTNWNKCYLRCKAML